MTNELPGMQDKSYITGGQADCDTEASEFEQWYVENAFDYVSNPIGSRDCGLQRKAWQASAARSAETIAGLKANIAHLKQIIHVEQLRCDRANERAAAAQADNARMREALIKIDALRNDIIDRQCIGWSSHVYPLVAILDDALAHPIDTSALEAYVAKQTAIPINADTLEIFGRPNFTCGHIARILRMSGIDIERRAENEQAHVLIWIYSKYLEHGAKWRESANEALRAIDAAPLPPAPDKQGE